MAARISCIQTPAMPELRNSSWAKPPSPSTSFLLLAKSIHKISLNTIRILFLLLPPITFHLSQLHFLVISTLSSLIWHSRLAIFKR